MNIQDAVVALATSFAQAVPLLPFLIIASSVTVPSVTSIQWCWCQLQFSCSKSRTNRESHHSKEVDVIGCCVQDWREKKKKIFLQSSGHLWALWSKVKFLEVQERHSSYWNDRWQFCCALLFSVSGEVAPVLN